jgi:hypothetical protein
MRAAIAHHGKLAFIDAGRTEFAGLVDPDHPVEFIALHLRLLC